MVFTQLTNDLKIANLYDRGRLEFYVKFKTKVWRYLWQNPNLNPNLNPNHDPNNFNRNVKTQKLMFFHSNQSPQHLLISSRSPPGAPKSFPPIKKQFYLQFRLEKPSDWPSREELIIN